MKNDKVRGEKQGLGIRLCRALELSPDVLPKKTLLEIHGEELVKITGAGGILLYTPEEIRIALRGKCGGYISVSGTGLCCSSYNRGAVGIEGKICAVGFCHGEENK